MVSATFTCYVYELVSLSRIWNNEKLKEASTVKWSFTFEGTFELCLKGCLKRSEGESIQGGRLERNGREKMCCGVGHCMERRLIIGKGHHISNALKCRVSSNHQKLRIPQFQVFPTLCKLEPPSSRLPYSIIAITCVFSNCCKSVFQATSWRQSLWFSWLTL